MNVILIGYRATGKTTVGALLSKKLKIPFVDTDHLIETGAGMPIRVLIEEAGWEAFRKKETEAVASLDGNHPRVVATGGGAILTAANRSRFKQAGVAVFLRASETDIVERLQRDMQDGGTRPRFTSESLAAETAAVLKERLPLYEAAADFTVDTQGKSIVQVADEIYQYLLEAGIVSKINILKKRLKNHL